MFASSSCFRQLLPRLRDFEPKPICSIDCLYTYGYFGQIRIELEAFIIKDLVISMALSFQLTIELKRAVAPVGPALHKPDLVTLVIEISTQKDRFRADL